MKTRVVVQTSEKIPVWQTAGSPEAMVERLRKLTAEIQLLQSELYRALAEEDGTPKRHFGMLNAGGEHLSAFKSAVDQFRRVLWFYGENLARSSGANAEISHGQKLQHDTEHTLTEQTTPGIVEPSSFFDRLNLVIDGYMQQNNRAPGKKNS